MIRAQRINEMERFQRELGQLFHGCGFAAPPSADAGARRFRLQDDESAFVVEAPLPGIDIEKLDISVLGRRLTLSGELAAAQLDEQATWHRQERDRGAFRQTLLLPVDVDHEQIEAVYENGILRVSLQKAASALPRKISVKAA